MHLLIPVAQAEFLPFIRKQGRATRMELAKASNKSYDAVRGLLRSLALVGLVVEYKSQFDNGANTFELCDVLAQMNDAEFSKLIENTVAAKGMPIPKKKKAKPVKSPVLSVLRDKKARSFIELNRPYMLSSAIAKKLGISAHTLECVEKRLGYKPLSADELDPQAQQIIGDLRFIPAYSKIEVSKVGGTTIHMPGNQPGITRITRYYGC